MVETSGKWRSDDLHVQGDGKTLFPQLHQDDCIPAGSDLTIIIEYAKTSVHLVLHTFQWPCSVHKALATIERTKCLCLPNIAIIFIEILTSNTKW